MSHSGAEPAPSEHVWKFSGFPVRVHTFLGVLLSGAVIGWGAWIAWKRSRPTPAPAQAVTATPVRTVISSPLSLWATRRETTVTITWDSERPSVTGARIGLLTVNDEGVKNEFPLTRTQLQSGKLPYASKSGFLEITMEVFSETGTSTRDSILMTASQPSAQTQTATVVVRQRTVSENPQAETPAAPAAEAPRVFVAQPVKPSQSLSSPLLIAENDRAGAIQVATASPPQLQAPAFLPSSTVQAPPPQPSSGLTQRLDQRLEERPAMTVTVQRPVPIRQVKPALTPAVAALVRRPVTVQVKVSIDAEGKVVNVEASVPPGTMNHYLAEAAANAARMWRFDPARRGDTKLPSETILHFAFGPKQ